MSPRKPVILVADDDAGIVRLVGQVLEPHGYHLISVADGPSAVRRAFEREADLILLDILMPGMDGFEVCRQIRQESNVPIIMLTGRDLDEDKVRGLEEGADDYITKPFYPDELVARVGALLRRYQNLPLSPVPITSGELVMDFHAHSVSLGGQDVALTPTEYRLLHLLASNAGRVLTYDYLVDLVWGDEYGEARHVLQVAIARLRQKLGDNPRHPIYIATRLGIGYLFLNPPHP